jgi:hypothetical protein
MTEINPGDRWYVTGPGEWPEFFFILMLANRWLIDTPGHIARLVNWHVEDNIQVGDPGVVVFEPSDVTAGGVHLVGCTFERCEPLPLAEWVADTVMEAWDARGTEDGPGGDSTQ